MSRPTFLALAAGLLLLAAAPATAVELDAAGCRDLPLFSRFPGYRIQRCETSDFETRAFRDRRGKEVKVEGRLGVIQYMLGEGTTKPSRVQLHRNHEAALRKLGQVTTFDDGEGTLFLRLDKDGREIWASVDAYITDQYTLTVVERAPMAQEVVATADAMAAGLKATGHVALYGILFDTGLAVIKPASEAAIAQVARLLEADPTLRLHVVGHTDAQGALDANLKLSQARAEAVVQVLTRAHGVAAARLRGAGVGPLCPVAVNDTEEGRARNRRVELVKQ